MKSLEDIIDELEMRTNIKVKINSLTDGEIKAIDKELQKRKRQEKTEEIMNFFSTNSTTEQWAATGFSKEFIKNHHGLSIEQILKMPGNSSWFPDHIPRDAVLYLDGFLKWKA
jgi:hypothetical protein